MTAPRRSYLICASQRTGSTMLCRSLNDTGLAGRPEEYFLAVDEAEMPDWRCWEHGPYGVALGATDRRDYLYLIYSIGTTSNGVFGAKLMWNNLRWAIDKFRELPAFAGLDRAEVLHAAFPGLRVIHVTRRDHLRQAISWALMAQTGVHVVSDAEPPAPTGEPEYDRSFIVGLIGLIETGEAGWRDMFDELGLTPYEVVYEDLLTEQGYEEAVRGVLTHLDLDLGEVAVPERRTIRQADTLTEAWIERYTAEAGT